MPDIKKLFVIEFKDAEDAAKLDPKGRNFRKITTPNLWKDSPMNETPLPDGEVRWTNESHGRRNIILSHDMGLSYVNEYAKQDPHWHPTQIESYASNSECILAYKAIDILLDAFSVIAFTGRVIIPARVCHYVKLSGFTEVLQVPTCDDVDKIGCDKCPQKKKDCSPEKGINAVNEFIKTKKIVS